MPFEIEMTHHKFDIQGHRGFRGRYPENSIPAFLAAIETGVTTLEMDVVISKDRKVVVSHDFEMLPKICLNPDKSKIDENNSCLYEMTYDKIRRFDCGSLGNPKFKKQEPMPVHKPLLAEVVAKSDAYTGSHHLAKVNFDIEIKSLPGKDHILHPPPDEYAAIVYEEIIRLGITDRTTIQSFDLRILRAFHENYPEIQLSLLIDDEPDVAKNFETLGFITPIYGPKYKLVTPEVIDFCHQKGILIIPWTVNKKRDMKQLIDWGVDGIITDYPDRLCKLIHKA